MMDAAKIHALGQGHIRVPHGRPAIVTLDPRRGGALAETAVAEVTGKRNPSKQLLIGLYSIFYHIL